MGMDMRAGARALGGVAVVLLTLSCNLMRPPRSAAPTATATYSLGAVEATPGEATPESAISQWSGTIQTTTNGDYGSAGTCTGEQWASTLVFRVLADMTVRGTGESHVVKVPVCSGTGAKYLKTDATIAHFDVEGNFDDKGIHLVFSETSIDGKTAGLFNYALLLRIANVVLDVPIISPGHAAVTIKVTRTIESATATAEHKVDLTCENCH